MPASLPIELRILGSALFLALFQILLTAHYRTKQYGVAWNMGARDETMPTLDPVPARLARAQANLFETLPLFLGAVLALAVAGRLGNRTTELGAILYLVGRVLYAPLYALGVKGVRTVAWAVALLGLVLLMWTLLTA